MRMTTKQMILYLTSGLPMAIDHPNTTTSCVTEHLVPKALLRPRNTDGEEAVKVIARVRLRSRKT